MSKFIVGSRLIAALLATVAGAACSSQSPVRPSASSSATAGDLSARPAQGAPGVYALSFAAWRETALEDVSSLSVSSEELILKAYVSDSSGAPAQSGTVTFEYCSYKGGPPNDITRADEAPKEACEGGSASWARLDAISVSEGRCPTLGTGYACMTFGIVQIPRDIGFRFRYSAKRSAIASGVSESKNFTWVEGP